MTSARLLFRFWGLSGRRRRLLPSAAWWVAVMGVAVFGVPFRVLVRVLGLQAGASAAAPARPAGGLAEDVGWAVAAVGCRTPWTSTCLVQALAALVMLRHRGVGSTLHLGVAMDAAAGFQAHAWLCCGDHFVTGGSEREGFTRLSTFSTPEAP